MAVFVPETSAQTTGTEPPINAPHTQNTYIQGLTPFPSLTPFFPVGAGRSSKPPFSLALPGEHRHNIQAEARLMKLR